MCDINISSFYQHSASKSSHRQESIDMLTPIQKTAYVHAVTCMISSFITLFFAVVEIILTDYVTTCPIDANVMMLVIIGQATSLIAPVSMLSLTAQMKRRLGRTPEEAVSTVTMLIIVTLFAVTLNVPPQLFRLAIALR